MRNSRLGRVAIQSTINFGAMDFNKLLISDARLKLDRRVQSLLQREKINTATKVLASSKVALRLIGLTDPEIHALKQQIADLSNNIFVTALECASVLAPCWRRITFGCAALDRVTGGGLSIRGLTEIAGESGCGKSQLCLQLSLCVQLPTSSGGADKSAVYICTEDAFPSRRLSQLAKLYRSRHGISDWMDKIFIEQLCDAKQLIECVEKRLPTLMETRAIGAIIIDSIAGIFRLETNAITRADDMRKVVLSLQALADRHECAVICVNQVTAAISANRPGCTVPCLGLAWSNLVTTRIILRKSDRTVKDAASNSFVVRTFEVAFSPDQPFDTAEYIITENGVCDAAI